MTRVTHRPADRAILVGLRLPNQKRWEVQESMEELARLAGSAGAEILASVVQDRAAPTPPLYFGRGKVEELRAIRKVADAHALPIHLDGARIFNAAVATGVDVREYTREADTMMFCVSKGLGAPIGSLVCGPAEAIREARRLKILFGGAWRQAGIMAAAGLIALEDGPRRLHEDHARARRLAEGVADVLPGSVDPARVETNMVYVDTEAVGTGALESVRRLAALGVGSTFVSGKVRMVTHVDVDDEGIAAALDAWRTIARDA